MKEIIIFLNRRALCLPIANQRNRGRFRWLEEYSVCAQHGLSCQPIVLQGDEATETMLRDLPLSQLAERYMLPEWRISEMEETVTICRNREGMCPEHKQMYHLGLNENGQYMAVY